MIAVLTGLIAGTVHVWSGPDHLAAIAPLAVRRGQPTVGPGIRWCLGHSAGVGIVGLLSLWLRDLLPKDLLSTWGERMVGVMLVGIGAWALRKAFKVHAHEHEHSGSRHIHMHAHHGVAKHEEREAHEHHSHAVLGIGMLHGLAGSSHFLGVLPGLAMPTRTQALGYFIAFAAGTIISMGSFSWVMGWLSSWASNGVTKIYRGLMGCCAAAAILVGLFWLLHGAV